LSKNGPKNLMSDIRKKLKLAILISGRGSNMMTIHKSCQDPDFPAEIALVLSNRPDAGGLAYAKDHNIPTEVVDHKEFSSRDEFEAEMHNRIEPYKPDLIILAGFLRILNAPFVKKWPNRILNIHPSLLPEYKGLNTHARAINDGKTESGCTVHYVVPELDSGQTIIQKRVPIFNDDTPETLEKRVLEQEHIAYPEAIKLVANNILSE